MASNAAGNFRQAIVQEYDRFPGYRAANLRQYGNLSKLTKQTRRCYRAGIPDLSRSIAER